MTDADFLRAIIDNPADDGPRLVYADWLEERGDHRGEFIQVQVELAKFPDNGTQGRECVRAANLRRRERELLKSHGLRWAKPVATSLGFPGRSGQFSYTGGSNPDGRFVRWFFCRGFVEEITCDWPRWLQHADAIRAATPLRKVKLTTAMGPTEDDMATKMVRVIGCSKWHPRLTSAKDMLAAEWPGVEFELSTSPVFENSRQLGGSYSQVLLAAYQAMGRQAAR